MIISHKHKFAFFRVPKTGSVTTNVLLRMEGQFGPDDILSKANYMGFADQNLGVDYEAQVDNQWDLIHATPTEAVTLGLITEAQLEEYACFAFVRDPYDRFISQMKHTGVKEHVFEMDKAVRHYAANLADLKTLGRPQASYFVTGFIEPLDFRNIDNEIRRLVPLVGGRPPRNLPILNKGRKTDTSDPFVWTPELRAMVADMYPEDIVLWNNFTL